MQLAAVGGHPHTCDSHTHLRNMQNCSDLRKVAAVLLLGVWRMANRPLASELANVVNNNKKWRYIIKTNQLYNKARTWTVSQPIHTFPSHTHTLTHAHMYTHTHQHMHPPPPHTHTHTHTGHSNWKPYTRHRSRQLRQGDLRPQLDLWPSLCCLIYWQSTGWDGWGNVSQQPWNSGIWGSVCCGYWELLI